MRILLVHNEYGGYSGEEAIFYGIRRLLEDRGHSIRTFVRSSAEIPRMRLGRLRAFFSGIYSWSSARAMGKELKESEPDIVHVHNVFPLVSPAILPVCRRVGVPVVMTVHNYRLVCPTGLHMRNGEICERCVGGREYWCVVHNCEGNLFKSVGYALRNYVARVRRTFLENVTLYTAVTEFQRQRLIAAGYPADRIAVIPNMARDSGADDVPPVGDYVAFVGRVSPEKGLHLLISAARKCPDIRFEIAGSYDRMRELPSSAPCNVEFLGQIAWEHVNRLLHGCRIVVMCSTCFEGFPVVLAESMLHSKPAIGPRIGGIPEIVEDGRTGFLFEPGNGESLREKLRHLWDRPDLCQAMGKAARQKALREYSADSYYGRLMEVYEMALKLGKGAALRPMRAPGRWNQGGCAGQGPGN